MHSAPSTALWTAAASACLTPVRPSRHGPTMFRTQTRGASFRTGIAAGHHAGASSRGQCADPPGRVNVVPSGVAGRYRAVKDRARGEAMLKRDKHEYEIS